MLTILAVGSSQKRVGRRNVRKTVWSVMAFDDCQIEGDNKAGSVLVKVEDRAVSDAAPEVDGEEVSSEAPTLAPRLKRDRAV